MTRLTTAFIALTLLTGAAFFLYAERDARAGSGYAAFVPVMRNARTDGLGMYIEMGLGEIHAPGLTALGVQYVRTIAGDWTGLSAYQTYLAEGWAGVDALIAADVAAMRSVGTPLIALVRGGACKVPSFAQLTAYAAFVAGFAERYDLPYIEAWNEPDAAGGLPGLYGCFGSQYTDRLIYLLERVRADLPATTQLGVSFMVQSDSHMAMLNAVVPYVDWIGVHHYAVWNGSALVDTYPGTLDDLYALVSDLPVPVLLTEVNGRDPSDTCSAAFREAQADYNLAALETDFEAKVILVYAGGGNWQCTGIKGSLTEQRLLGLPGYP